MSTAVMMERTTGASPRFKARIAGALYLIVIAGGLFAEVFVRQRLIVPSDAAATARNILAHEQLYRLGFAAGLVCLVCNIPFALIFYELFKVVNKSLALLLAFFVLVATAIETVNYLNHFAPLIFLSRGSYLSAFTGEQLQALAYASLRLFAVGFGMSLVFFAFYCFLIGYLIFKSVFAPRIVGVLMAIAGLCYLTNSFVYFLAPWLSGRLFPWILLPCFVAELSLALWLLVIGVNVQRWKEQASAAGEAAGRQAI